MKNIDTEQKETDQIIDYSGKTLGEITDSLTSEWSRNQIGPENEIKQSEQSKPKNWFTNLFLGKRKKLAVLLGTLAVCMLMIGAGTAYAYPYIHDVVLPRKQLAQAIENETNLMLQNLQVQLTGLTESTTDAGIRYTGTFTLNDQMVDDRNLIDELNVDTVAFDAVVQTKEETISGTLQLKDGTDGTSKLEVSFTLDATGATMQIPALFQESITLNYSDTGYGQQIGYAWKGLVQVLGNPDAGKLSEYQSSIEAAAKDVMTGIRTMLEKSTIERTQTLELDSTDGKQKVDVFVLTITPDAWKAGIDKMLEAVYSDQEMNSYLTLIGTYTGMAKNELQERATEIAANMQDTPIILCVSSDNRILSFDLKYVQPAYGIDLELSAGYIIDESIADDCTYQITVNQADLVTDHWNQYVPELTLSGCSGRIVFSKKDTVFTLHQLQGAGQVIAQVPAEWSSTGKEETHRAYVDLSYSATWQRSKVITDLNNNTQVIRNQTVVDTIDLFHYTQKQEDSIASQLEAKQDVVKTIVTEETYNWMMN